MKTKVVVLDELAITRLTVPLYLIGFLLPFLVAGPQWLTGTLVNALLFFGSTTLSRKKLFPLVVFPSVGAVLHGVLFGPFTLFLVYMLPFIWMGNGIFVLLARLLANKLPSVFRLAIAAVSKAIFLFFLASLLYQNRLVPLMFLKAMGTLQLATALAGGMLVLAAHRLGILKYE